LLTKQRRPDLWTLYENRRHSARRPGLHTNIPPDGRRK
jgi:hypothetical protein